MAEADGNRTRQGARRPLNGFEDRGAHQALAHLRPKCSHAPLTTDQAERLSSASHLRRSVVKKLLLLVIVVALGAALAKKVRTA